MRLVLFDIDGTLIHTNGAGMQGLTRAMREVCMVDLSRLGISPAGLTDPLIVREALQKADVDAAQWQCLEERIFPLYEGYLAELMAVPDPGRRLAPGVLEVLQRLEPDPRFALGLLTGNMERTARIKLEPFGLNPFFPIGAYGSDSHDRCLLGAIALERARRHFERAFDPSEVWIVGDTPRDIAAARAFGAKVLAVSTGPVSLAELEALHPDAALPDLADLEKVLALFSES